MDNLYRLSGGQREGRRPSPINRARFLLNSRREEVSEENRLAERSGVKPLYLEKPRNAKDFYNLGTPGSIPSGFDQFKPDYKKLFKYLTESRVPRTFSPYNDFVERPTPKSKPNVLPIGNQDIILSEKTSENSLKLTSQTEDIDLHEMAITLDAEVVQNYPVVSKSVSKLQEPANKAGEDGDAMAARRVIEFLHELWKNGSFVDVKIRTADDDIYAHRVIMAAYSKVLLDTFKQQNQSTMASLELLDVSSEDCKEALNFLYTADIFLTDKNVLGILRSSVCFNIQILIKICSHYLSQCSPETALTYHGICKENNLLLLAASIWRFICENFEAVSSGVEYEKCTLLEVISLLSDDRIKVSSEMVVLDRAVHWLQKNSNRLVNVWDVLNCVRFPLLKPEQLSRLEKHPYLSTIPDVLTKLYRAVCFHSLNETGSTMAKQYAAKPRLGPMDHLFPDVPKPAIIKKSVAQNNYAPPAFMDTTEKPLEMPDESNEEQNNTQEDHETEQNVPSDNDFHVKIPSFTSIMEDYSEAREELTVNFTAPRDSLPLVLASSSESIAVVQKPDEPVHEEESVCKSCMCREGSAPTEEVMRTSFSDEGADNVRKSGSISKLRIDQYVSKFKSEPLVESADNEKNVLHTKSHRDTSLHTKANTHGKDTKDAKFHIAGDRCDKPEHAKSDKIDIKSKLSKSDHLDITEGDCVKIQPEAKLSKSSQIDQSEQEVLKSNHVDFQLVPQLCEENHIDFQPEQELTESNPGDDQIVPQLSESNHGDVQIVPQLSESNHVYYQLELENYELESNDMDTQLVPKKSQSDHMETNPEIELSESRHQSMDVFPELTESAQMLIEQEVVSSKSEHAEFQPKPSKSNHSDTPSELSQSDHEDIHAEPELSSSAHSHLQPQQPEAKLSKSDHSDMQQDSHSESDHRDVPSGPELCESDDMVIHPEQEYMTVDYHEKLVSPKDFDNAGGDVTALNNYEKKVSNLELQTITILKHMVSTEENIPCNASVSIKLAPLQTHDIVNSDEDNGSKMSNNKEERQMPANFDLCSPEMTNGDAYSKTVKSLPVLSGKSNKIPEYSNSDGFIEKRRKKKKSKSSKLFNDKLQAKCSGDCVQPLVFKPDIKTMREISFAWELDTEFLNSYLNNNHLDYQTDSQSRDMSAYSSCTANTFEEFHDAEMNFETPLNAYISPKYSPEKILDVENAEYKLQDVINTVCQTFEQTLSMDEQEARDNSDSDESHYVTAETDLNPIVLEKTSLKKIIPDETNSDAELPTGPDYDISEPERKTSAEDIEEFSSAKLSYETEDEVPVPITKRSNGKMETTKRDSGKGLLYMVGGLSMEKRRGLTVSAFCDTHQKWKTVSRRRFEIHHHAAVFLMGKLYVIGGAIHSPHKPEIFSKVTKKVHSFDIARKRWRTISSMISKRVFHSAVAHGESIYVVGGEDSNGHYPDAVEMYSTSNATWHIIAQLLGGGRIGAGTAICNNRLFVVGGYNPKRKNCILKDVLSLHLDSYSWEVHRPMTFPRCHAVLACVNQSLFLIGGMTQTHKADKDTPATETVNSVHRYEEPNENWTPVDEMPTPLHDATAAIYGGKIYLMGGMKTPQNTPLRKVYSFDTKTYEWTTESFIIPRQMVGASAAVLCN